MDKSPVWCINCAVCRSKKCTFCIIITMLEFLLRRSYWINTYNLGWSLYRDISSVRPCCVLWTIPLHFIISSHAKFIRNFYDDVTAYKPTFIINKKYYISWAHKIYLRSDTQQSIYSDLLPKSNINGICF